MALVRLTCVCAVAIPFPCLLCSGLSRHKLPRPAAPGFVMHSEAQLNQPVQKSFLIFLFLVDQFLAISGNAKPEMENRSSRRQACRLAVRAMREGGCPA